MILLYLFLSRSKKTDSTFSSSFLWQIYVAVLYTHLWWCWLACSTYLFSVSSLVLVTTLGKYVYKVILKPRHVDFFYIKCYQLLYFLLSPNFSLIYPLYFYLYSMYLPTETRQNVNIDEWLDVWGDLLRSARTMESLPLWLQYFPKILFQVINKSGKSSYCFLVHIRKECWWLFLVCNVRYIHLQQVPSWLY